MSKTNILVLNCGSSSIKFAIFAFVNKCLKDNSVLCSGLVEKIGQPKATFTINFDGKKQTQSLEKSDYASVLEFLLNHINSHSELGENIAAVGHRVVHGGEHFSQSVLIDEKGLKLIEKCNELAPLHNPVNILGIRAAQFAFAGIPQVAVFDTAFHQTIPEVAYIYPLPYQLYQDHHVRRYGFHGTSHRFVVQQAAKILSCDLAQSHFISLHLGNGCSACAVANGKSVDTTMGLTPLEGLMMGTRSGDVDPGLHDFLAQHLHYSSTEINTLLNTQSGLLGVSGESMDMRDLHQLANSGHERAKLAIDIFCYRVSKTVAALSIVLDKVDALIFTAGIGENDALIRSQVVAQLKRLNFYIDDEKNKTHGQNNDGIIHQQNSCPILVVPTNEEQMIAQDAINLIWEPKS